MADDYSDLADVLERAHAAALAAEAEADPLIYGQVDIARLPPPLPAPFPRYDRPAGRRVAWRDDHAGQSLLHVPPQLGIHRQLRCLLEAAGARGGVTAQLPRDRRRRLYGGAFDAAPGSGRGGARAEVHGDDDPGDRGGAPTGSGDAAVHGRE